MKQTTLCYLERGSQYLMLHRTKKENDLNHDKWLGVGGKFEDGESPEDCMLREVWEETGGDPIECNEGDLEWIEKQHLLELTMWEGDKVFLCLINEHRPFFSLKLTYEYDTLKKAVLDGVEIQK